MNDRVVSCLFLIFISAMPYLNTLNGAFVYDDSEMILENPNVRGKTTLAQMFFDRRVMSFSGEIYRPLRDVSYRMDYLIGGKKPNVYHVTNILLHTITTLAAYWFLMLLFKGGSIPLLAAAIFAVHPLHTESVAWVKGRDDILFTLFYLLSFGMYLKSRDTDGWKVRFYFFASILLFILSLFSKELAVTLPLTIALYQMIFKRVKLHNLIPFFVISAAYIALRTYVLGQVAQQEEYWGGSFNNTMLTMTNGIVQYVRLCFLPVNQCADYLFPISTGIDYGVMLSLSLLSLGFAFLFFYGDRYILWGGLFFFISLLPVINIIPIKIIIAERFLYLPLVGYCAVIASGLHKVFRTDWSVRIVGAIVVFFLVLLTIQRNHVWIDEYSLWSDTIKKSPQNSRAHYGLGSAYVSKGMMDKAFLEYKESVKLAPGYPYAFYGLGLIYDKRGMPKEAASLYKDALKNDPTHRDARYNLALLYQEQGRLDEAIVEFRELLKRRFDDFDALNGLGLAYFQKGLFEEALMQYKKALNIDLESVAPYNNIGMVYAVRGKKTEAETWFKKALDIEPASVEAYYNLGLLYQRSNRLADAERMYRMALSIKQDYEEARERLSEIKK